MMQNELDFDYNQAILDTILSLISFLGMLITVMNEKIGNPDTLQQALTLSQILKGVQQYNYFSLEILSDVMAMSDIKLFHNLKKQRALEIIQHRNLKNHFKKSPQSIICTKIREVTECHRNNIAKIHKEIVNNSVRKQVIQTGSIKEVYSREQFEEGLVTSLRDQNLHYRQTMRIWRKVWKRLRLLHYYWSVGMDQRQNMQNAYVKQQSCYKHKFSKITDKYGLRSILSLEPNQPWHIRKMQMDEQTRYRSSNFLFNLYKHYDNSNTKPKSFLEKVFSKSSQDQEFSVEWIKHNSKRKGTLRLSSQKLIFVYDSTFQKDSHLDFTSFTLAEYKPISKQWQLVSITSIFKRRYLTRANCLLIEFQDSTSLIFNFIYKNLDQFIKIIQIKQQSKIDKLNFLKLNKVRFYTQKWNGLPSIQSAIQAWRSNKISTLEYLMLLNKYSGRSFLDPVHYPVIPWIIANYQCKELVYRDLEKTLGALGNEGRRSFYRSKTAQADPFSQVPPYHYGTHYSSPGVVFNFLIRLSPYTQAGKTLQGGKFDLSDRLFNSMRLCWHSVNSQNSDVRELVPEFYYLPQFLINIENHDFGVTQQGQRVHNVSLPLWGENAFQFIGVHRKALQSQPVIQNIQNWIDLIFGYKQKGKLAEEHLNLYYYLTYENAIDLETIEDQVQKNSVQAQIIHFGQTPSQLFTKPHPPKYRFPSKQIFSYRKVRFIGSLQTASSIVLLFKKNDKLYLFKDSTIVSLQYKSEFRIQTGLTLLRSSSKDNIFHVEDVTCDCRVAVFGSQKFIVIGAYVNGDLVVYSLLTGAKLEQKKGSVKSCVFVNAEQNLLICGCTNGLLQVYEIVYGEKDSVKLIEIASEYYLFPIQHISEGGGFTVVSSGNLSVVNKITRSMSYVYDKKKRRGCKMMRSIESKRKILGSFIVSNPLFSLVFYNSLQVYVYSINGQRLTTKQIQILLPPIIIKDQSLFQYMLVLLEKSVVIYRLPDLEIVKAIPIPSKQYIDMKVIDKNIFLVTNMGEILYFTDDQ